MFSQKELMQKYYKHRDVLIDVFSSCYGENNREDIIKKLNSTFFDFTSNPVEEYKFAQRNKKRMSLRQYNAIKLMYLDYQNILKRAEEQQYESLKKCVKKYFGLTDFENVDKMKNTFLLMFMDLGAEYGYIDAYDSKNTSLLCGKNVPESIKVSVAMDRGVFEQTVSSLGVDMSKLDVGNVEMFKKEREVIKEQYEAYVTKNSKYGKYLKKAADKAFGRNMEMEHFIYLAFKNNSCAGRMFISEQEGYYTGCYHFVKVPFTKKINDRQIGLDVDFIHELIHRLEQNTINTGIQYQTGEEYEIVKNEYANEVRTQKLAAKIVYKLKQKGVNIFDDPNTYTNFGESAYEMLYPLVGKFFDKYENIFNECAYNNDYKRLNKLFGDSWELFSDRIDAEYYNCMLTAKREKKILMLEPDEEIIDMIEKMEKHYEEEVRRECLKV